MKNINDLKTEGVNKRARDIDSLSTTDVLSIINAEDKMVAIAVERELLAIEAAVEAIVSTLQNGGRLFYIGAGTSGRLGVLDASECPPTFNTSPELIQGVIAGGLEALIKSSEGIEDNSLEGEEDLKARGFSKIDILIGIAASGRTPYVIGALKYARSLGAKTACITCNKGSAMAHLADTAIEVEVGPEVLSGSTRMKSGTAQKMVLNMLTTTAMVRLGKVYKGLMVDMKASNDKLKIRAIRMVTQTVSCDDNEAKRILVECEWNTKLAIVCGLTGQNTKACRALLNENSDNIRLSLKAYYKN